MVEIKYLNNVYKYNDAVNGFNLSKELFKDGKAIGIIVNGKKCDLSTTVTTTSEIDFIAQDSVDGLDILRHSTAHLMAYAVKKLYKSVKITVGPSIENGFYYDFDVEKPFSESDFEMIEKKMQEIVKKDERFFREEWTRNDALEYFKSINETYKVELINEIPENEIISVYKLGSYVDLCRGPHVPSTRYLKYFKLTKVAGAYWRGDSKNKMLQRIYGTAWDSKENLDKYFEFLEEAEKRDHKKICKIMDLAHFDPEFAPGSPFYHPKGLFLYNALISHMRKKQEEAGYIEVLTPRIMDRSLWETSGHWEHYGEHNYSGKTEDGRQFCVKPMNCPGGILIYKQGLKSYRDLPIKMAEFGRVNRYEASGALNGFLRVREFTQDDAHIFCTQEQVEEQCIETIEFLLGIYKDFGFEDIRIKLSTRPEGRIGSEEIWDLAEKSLAESLDKLGLAYTLFPGEGAFYGPKLEFVLKDALGRDWQIGTIQLDMNLPKRFEMTYVGEDGQKHEPIMLHRAILGSIERFLGILIEHTEGRFPLWLNPVQVVVATITNDVDDYANYVVQQLKLNDIRCELDNSSEKINYKIREHSLKKVPFIFSIGKKEKENKTVSIRTIGSNSSITLPLKKVIEVINKKVNNKDRDYDLID